MNAPQCYHCGRYSPSHREMCPDHPQWRKLAPIMTQAEFDRLIPAGEWAHERAVYAAYMDDKRTAYIRAKGEKPS